VPLPTLDDFKTHLNIPGTSNDAELADVLSAARDVVEAAVGSLATQTITETHRNMASDVVILNHRPAGVLVSIDVRAYPGSGKVTQDLLDYDLDPESGLLRLASGYPIFGDVTVSYTSGFETVPYAVWLATLIIGAHLWETQRGAQPLPLQGGEPDLLSSGSGYAVPNRAAELLAPYARGSQVA
jgi:hypothetical protein